MDRPCALVVSTVSDAEALQQLNARLNQLGAVRVVPGPWTPENGLLTATHKLNRRHLRPAPRPARRHGKVNGNVL